VPYLAEKPTGCQIRYPGVDLSRMHRRPPWKPSPFADRMSWGAMRRLPPRDGFLCKLYRYALSGHCRGAAPEGSPAMTLSPPAHIVAHVRVVRSPRAVLAASQLEPVVEPVRRASVQTSLGALPDDARHRSAVLAIPVVRRRKRLAAGTVLSAVHARIHTLLISWAARWELSRHIGDSSLNNRAKTERRKNEVLKPRSVTTE
jgi:hypothetical protein